MAIIDPFLYGAFPVELAERGMKSSSYYRLLLSISPRFWDSSASGEATLDVVLREPFHSYPPRILAFIRQVNSTPEDLTQTPLPFAFLTKTNRYKEYVDIFYAVKSIGCFFYGQLSAKNKFKSQSSFTFLFDYPRSNEHFYRKRMFKFTSFLMNQKNNRRCISGTHQI